MSQTVDEEQNSDERGMKQLGARLPQWMIDDLHKASKKRDVPIRQLVENFIAAGLEDIDTPRLQTLRVQDSEGFDYTYEYDRRNLEPDLVPNWAVALIAELVRAKWEDELAIALLQLHRKFTDIEAPTMDAFREPRQDQGTDREAIETGRPQGPPGDIAVLTVDHLHRLTSLPLIRLLDALQDGPISLADAKRIARGSSKAADLLHSVHGVLIDLDVDAARVAPLVGWPELPPDLRVRRLLAEGVSTSHIRGILAAHIAGPITGIGHLARLTGMSRHTARDAHACLEDLNLLSIDAPDRDPHWGDGDA